MTDAVAATAAAPAPEPRQVDVGMAMTVVAARMSEAAALLGAGLYSLGVLRISGELRELHLSTPTVLASFTHHDVLMKGVGVLVSHLTSSLILALLLLLFASPTMLNGLNRVITGAAPLSLGGRVGAVVALATFVLGARYWEGLLYVLVVALVIGGRWRRRIAVGRGALLALMLAGMAFIGLVGSYLHAPPLMTITAVRDGAHDTGLLVGTGDHDEWFVAVQEENHFNLEVFGGNGEKIENLQIHPARDEDYRTVLFQIWDHATGHRHRAKQPLA